MRTIILGVLVLFALLWLWPNVVHEPLHVMALQMQGSDGYAQRDWTFPVAPVTHRTEPVNGVVGGLLFLLLPTLFSALVLTVLWVTKKQAGFITHVILPLYLSYDAVLNMINYARPVSDFYFLTALPSWVLGTVVVSTIVVGGAVLCTGMVYTQRNAHAQKKCEKNKEVSQW